MHAEAYGAIQKCPDIDGVIATMIQNLDEPSHRLRMISALLNFAGPDLRRTGSVIFIGDNPTLDALKDKARDIANQAADVKTVTDALADPELRDWAVSKFGNPLGRPEEWRALLPREESAASDKDDALRSAAVSALARFPGAGKFLDERFAIEKSPMILMGLLHSRDIWGEEFNRRFLPRFVHLLSDRDELVRNQALWYIWATYNWADVYRLPFGEDVFDLVIKATQSKSAKERGIAAHALTCLRHLGTDSSREAFLRLVNDPDENVRLEIGEGLAGQYERNDVKRAIAALVKDKSPLAACRTLGEDFLK